MVGKFADEQSLIKSYECLEKEFTKKCQELAKIKKEMEEKVENEEKAVVNDVLDLGAGAVQEEEEKLPLVEAAAGDEGAFESAEVCRPSERVNEENEGVVFDEKFKKLAGEFLEKFPDAKNSTKEIAKELILNKKLLEMESPFYLAYLIVKDKRKVEEKPAQKIEKVLDKSEKEPEKDVFSKILKGSAGGFAAPSRKKYSSFEDARGDLISKYFS